MDTLLIEMLTKLKINKRNGNYFHDSGKLVVITGKPKVYGVLSAHDFYDRNIDKLTSGENIEKILRYNSIKCVYDNIIDINGTELTLTLVDTKYKWAVLSFDGGYSFQVVYFKEGSLNGNIVVDYNDLSEENHKVTGMHIFEEDNTKF